MIGYFNQFAGKAYLKINLLVKTPFHRRSLDVARSLPGETIIMIEKVKRKGIREIKAKGATKENKKSSEKKRKEGKGRS